MKQCSKCKEFKPPEEFHKRSNAKDGLASWCKLCFKKYDAARHPARYSREAEKIKERSRRFYQNNKEKRLQYISNWIKENPDKHRNYVLKYSKTKAGLEARIKSNRKHMESNPHIVAVWKVTQKALKEGLIQLDSSCKYCGRTTSLTPHHPDYSKPLDIETVCRKCHGRITQGLSPI